MKYQALLFDLDGTLINTLDLWSEAVIETLARHGASVTPETFREWYTRPSHLKNWLEWMHLSDKEDVIRAQRDARYIELLKERVTWLDGAEEMLESLSSLIPLGLITGSWKAYVDASEERLHFQRYFQTLVVCDDMGKFQKPHPHGILMAADRLGVEPERCLYVGDQLFDVQAAQAAGMPCCIVRGSFTPDTALQQADIVVESLRELKGVVEL